MARSLLAVVVAVLVVGALASACQQSEPVVGKAYLIEALGTRPAPEGPTIEVGHDTIPAALHGPVRVAIDRDVPYTYAVAMLQRIKVAGGDPVPLVAVREHVEGLVAPDAKTGEAINLWADRDGQTCIAPHDSPTATCIVPQALKHIDRAFVRDVMAKAVREYELTRVHVMVDPSLSWGDAVRAIDGARTCCGPDVKLEVSVNPGW
jgi:hypothetical protein